MIIALPREYFMQQRNVKSNILFRVFIKLRIFYPPSLSPSKGRDEAVVT